MLVKLMKTANKITEQKLNRVTWAPCNKHTNRGDFNFLTNTAVIHFTY